MNLLIIITLLDMYLTTFFTPLCIPIKGISPSSRRDTTNGVVSFILCNTKCGEFANYNNITTIYFYMDSTGN